LSPWQVVSTLPNPEPEELVTSLSLCSRSDSQALPILRRHCPRYLTHTLCGYTARNQPFTLRFAPVSTPRGHSRVRADGAGKDPLVLAYFQHIVETRLLQAVSQATIRAIHTVACHPLSLQAARVLSTHQQGECQITFGF